LLRGGVVAVLSACAALAFATPALAQTTVTTGPPIAVTTTGAEVSITFNPGGAGVGYQLLVGPTGSPLTSQEGFLTGPFSGTDDVNETVGLSNLMPNTSYTYQAEVVEFDNDATTDGATGTFTTTSVPTGPGTPIVPPQNPLTDGIFSGECSTDTECLADLNGDTALQEGLPPVALPSNWTTLTAGEQLFVATNLERVVRGETPIANFVNSYDAAVQAGVQSDSDPSLADLPGLGGSNWAGGNPIPLGAEYGWLDLDGPGGGNLDCTTPTDAGCFGHRDNILANASGPVGDPTEMDAAAGTDSTGSNSYTEIFVNNPNPTAASAIVLSWATEQQFLAPPPLGGLAPHGPIPKDSHLVFSKSTFAALAGRLVPAVVLNTQLDRKAGTVVSYGDTQVATTTFTVKQQLAGVIKNGRCVAAPRHKRKGVKACVRTETLGSFVHADAAGANRFRFLGRLNGRVLKPGAYLMSGSPRSRSGRRGAAVQHAFKVVR
jgi:hypothetical protein